MIYNGAGFDDLAKTVRTTTADLRPHLSEFDSIVVRGLSGVVVGSPVSMRLRKPLVVVRKDCELEGNNSHASGMVENLRRLGKRYLWLDDFVSSGATRVAVWSSIYHYADDDAKMVLEYHYRDQYLTETETCLQGGCDAAVMRQYRTCDYCHGYATSGERFNIGKCTCRSGSQCGRGHWQS